MIGKHTPGILRRGISQARYQNHEALQFNLSYYCFNTRCSPGIIENYYFNYTTNSFNFNVYEILQLLCH